MMRRIIALLFLAILASTSVLAQDRHPAMENSWWINLGSFLAERDFKASAKGGVGGINREFDFEESLGLGDSPDLLMGELGWQFGENWGVALQYFRSQRDRNWVLEESFEWQGNLYDVGARVDAGVKSEITRVFFARRFRDNGPHSLRLGVGVHWLELSAEISGEANLGNQGTGFRRSVASASVPIPNVGAWYRYSPNNRWMLSARIDWLSASVDDYSGDIWNAAAGINYRLWDHIGIGASYQYFEISGRVKEDNWRGDITATYTGPYLYISGFW